MPTQEDEKKKQDGEKPKEENPKETARKAAQTGKEKEAAAALVEAERSWDPGEFLWKELLNREESSGRRDYFDLINYLPESQAPPENYAKHWSDLLQDKDQKENQKKIAMLEKVLAGKILVDLGGGKGEHLRGDGVYEYATYAPAPMQEVAQRFQVKTYVNVDRYHTSRDIYLHDVTEQLGIEQPQGMHVVYVGGDMLKLLSKMPDQRPEVVLVLNGIDAFVIKDRDYRKALGEEIARIVPPGGAVLTCGSEDITEHLEKLGFEIAEGFPKQGWPAYPQIWIKK